MIGHLSLWGVIALISGIVFFAFNKANENINKKKFIFFVLAFAILLALPATISAVGFNQPMTPFILFQLYSLLLGSVFIYLLSKWYSIYFDKRPFSEVFATLLVLAIGALGFFQLFYYFDKDYAGIFPMALIPFFLPMLLVNAFFYFRRIPAPTYKLWYFPVDTDPKDLETYNSDLIVINLEFLKNQHDSTAENLKLKAPLDMGFGDYFQAFVDKYNSRFHQEQIQFIDDNRRMPFAWFFSALDAKGRKKYIDPDLSIKANQIKEGQTIVAERVKE